MTAIGPDSYTWGRFDTILNDRTTIVGTWPVLADDDDATYAWLGADAHPSVGAASPQNGDAISLFWTTPFNLEADESTVVYNFRLKVDPDQPDINESRVQIHGYNNRFDDGDSYGDWVISMPNPDRWYDLSLVRGPKVDPILGSIVYYADDNGHDDGDPASDCWVAFQNKSSSDWTTDGSDNDDPWPGLMVAASLGTLQFDINRTGGAFTTETGNLDAYLAEWSIEGPDRLISGGPGDNRRRFT